MGWDWLFKYSWQTFERGQLVFAGLGAVWWLAAGFLLALGIAFARRCARWPLARRIAIHGLQLAAAALLLGLIAAPALEVMRVAPSVNTVAVLLDTSASMALPAAGVRSAGGAPLAEGETRLDAAKRLLRDAIEPALGDVDVALFGFDARLRGRQVHGAEVAAAQPQGHRTHLVDALTDLASNYDQGALAAVVVLTDGADNGGGIDLEALAAAAVPVHPLGIGPARIGGDVELRSLTMPRRAAPNTRVHAQLVIHHANGGEVQLRVRDGEAVLATETVTLDPASAVVGKEIAFSSGRAGLKEITVELAASGADPLPANNRRTRLLEVAASRYRVLYLEGEPRWEFKFIRRAVAEDDAIDLLTWLRTTPRKSYRQGVAHADELRGGFPATREALYGYQLLILGSLPAAALDDQQHRWLEAFVSERGGSVLVLAGRQALAAGGWDVKPLAQALPVVLARTAAQPSDYASGEYAVEPTPAGLTLGFAPLDLRLGDASRDAVARWRTLPKLADLQRLGVPKPGATVLLRARGEGGLAPLLVAQPYGFGSSAVLATASTWRWRMRTPPEDDRHALFWRQLIRQLAAAAQPQRRVSVVPEGGALDVRMTLKDALYQPVVGASVTAHVTQANGETFETSLPAAAGEDGVFGKTIPVQQDGIYRVDVAARLPDRLGPVQTTTAMARVGSANMELFDAALNEPLLARIARATGGRLWRPDDLAELPEAIAYGGAGIRERQRLPLWDMPFLFLLLVILKCVEWSLRRYWGSI